MRFRKQRSAPPAERIDQEKEDRLVDAEKRAIAVLAKAEWLHAVVGQRDKENCWQDSVNQLFLGGQSS